MSVTFSYALALIVAFAVTLVLVPPVSRLAVRLGLLDRPKPDRFHRETTPYLGGVAVAGGVISVGVFAAGMSAQVTAILGCGVVLAALGLVDDWRTVGPVPKLLVQLAAGFALWFAGVRAEFFGVALFDLALTVAWVVVVTNAVNLIDNMDGLACGAAAISALTLFAIVAWRGNAAVGCLALAVAGASLGLLRYNFPPARVFLGDTGTLLLGFLLAAIALQVDLVGSSRVVSAAVPVLALGVPLFDTALVVVARVREARPPYVGGTDHTSHRLVALGLSSRQVALLTYAAQLGCSTVALLLVCVPQSVGLAGVFGVGLVAGMALVRFLALPYRSEPRPA